MPGPDRVPFHYAIIRVIPHVERGERMNAGIVLHCRSRDFLRAGIALDEARLLALAPDIDLTALHRHLRAIERICQGHPDAGPVASLPMAERFGWLVSPKSTIIQQSAPHVGLCHDPEQALVALLDKLVAPLRVRTP